MPLILAVEPDRRQASRIAAVLRTRPRTELVIGESAANVLGALAGRIPDVLLTSPLLSRQDEAALAAWLRGLGPAAARVQALTIPILANAAPAPARRRGVLSVLRGRGTPTTTPDGCEPSMFADQVGLYLDRASAERDEAGPTHASPLPPTYASPVPTNAESAMVSEFEAAMEPEPVVAMSIDEAPAPILVEHPIEQFAAPVEEAVAPIEELAAPIEEFAALPAEVTVEPVAEILEPAAAMIAAPVAEIVEPVAGIEAPVAEIAASAGQELPAATVQGRPALASRLRSVMSAWRSEETADPVAEIIEPVAAMIAEPVAEIVEPVARIEAPVAEFAASPGQELPAATVQDRPAPASRWRSVMSAWRSEETVDPAAEIIIEPVSAKIAEPIAAMIVEPVAEIVEPVAGIEAPVAAIAASAGQELPATTVQDRPALASRLRGAMSTWGWRREPLPVDTIAAAAAPPAPLAIEAPAAVAPLMQVVIEEIPERRTAITAPDTERLWVAVPLEGIVDTAIASAKPAEVPRADDSVWVLTPTQIPQMYEQFAAAPARPAAPTACPPTTLAAPARPAAPTAWAPATPAAPEPVPAAQPTARKRAGGSKPRPKPKPVQDEWGFFDPEQCGFAALLAKLDEITEESDEDQNRPETTVQIIGY